MTTLFKNLTSSLSASNRRLRSHGDGFTTAKRSDDLFPRTRPEIDGDDCLTDCDTCTISYPRKFKIDESARLYGELQRWSQHVLIATGKADWTRNVEDEPQSLMQALERKQSSLPDESGFMLTASNMPVPEAGGQGPYGPSRPTTVLLMPAFQIVENATPDTVDDLIQLINKASTTTSRLSDATDTVVPPPGNLTLRPCPHRYLVLLCSQGTRDARCGQSAPLLRRELERHLRPLGLYRDLADERPGGVGIYFISHIGGHKFSANMIIYRRAEGEEADGHGCTGEAVQGIWLARVQPADIENIVRYTILQGKVVKPERQLRGGFDRTKCIVSW